MPQNQIDSILRTGSNRNNSLLRIVSFYQKDKSLEEEVDFLQKEYQGGKGLYIEGQKIAIWFHTDGIHISKGETALYSRSKEVISWTDVAERIEELLNGGQYATQDILDNAELDERQQVAENFWYLHQDFSDDIKNQFFDEEIFKGGFPDSTNHIAQLLDDPKERGMIIESLQEFNSAYEQDPTILRFHFHKPQKLLSDLTELDLPRREFSSTLTNVDDFIMFITQDEVDKELTSGSGVQSGKYRIFDYFTQSHSPKEKEDFLKQEYGIGGRSHALSGADNSNQMHDAKGILYSRRDNDDKLLLNWSKVAKCIDYLISINRYMTNEEKERFEELQRENVGIEETLAAPSLTDESIDSTRIHQPLDKLTESEELAEINIIPFEKGDTVYLENGTPFLIEEITDYHITLRDPSLLYPILRSESRESFLRLLELYPQSQVPQEKAENYRITDEHLGEGSKREKFAGNVAAITTLQTIERERRPATKEEQEILSHYVGWGGLSEVFDKDNSSFSSEYAQLKSLLSEDEYSMARASTLNAHYTSPTVIKAIYDAVERMGFTTGNILEPACGTGHFFGMLPDSMQNSNLYGIELDSITGRIAKQLYPNANISITGFEKTELPDSFFDIAIGNVPFGNYKLSEKRYDKNNFLIHDHFFAKALDKVRPGGVVAFITSKGTMDKQSPDVRRYLAQRAELLGAIRLPNNAFLRNAGTEVTSDIIFLQKRDRPIDVDRDWIHLDTNEDGIALNS
jgi:hypothetical protein